MIIVKKKESENIKRNQTKQNPISCILAWLSQAVCQKLTSFHAVRMSTTESDVRRKQRELRKARHVEQTRALEEAQEIGRLGTENARLKELASQHRSAPGNEELRLEVAVLRSALARQEFKWTGGAWD